MATKVATAKSTRPARKSRKPEPEFKSKSAEALSLLKAGNSISQVEALMAARGKPMGYAFIYGVAKRNNLNLSAAKRRAVRAISKDKDGVVTVQTARGPVLVSPDGTVGVGNITITAAGLVVKSRTRVHGRKAAPVAEVAAE